MNFGILLFNVGFARAQAIKELDADCFSTPGQLMVLIWGVAFLCTGLSDHAPLPLLWGGHCSCGRNALLPSTPSLCAAAACCLFFRVFRT